MVCRIGILGDVEISGLFLQRSRRAQGVPNDACQPLEHAACLARGP